MRGNKVLLISGTPASGKDTVTSEIIKLSPKFVHFRKHKIGYGGKLDDTYHLVAKHEFDRFVSQGEFVQFHYRYDRGYGVSKSELNACWSRETIPIIHVGKYENLPPFFDEGISSTSVLLLSSISATRKRLEARHGDDKEEIQARLHAYIEERREFAERIITGEELLFDFIIENSNKTPGTIARIVVGLFGL